MENRLLQAVSRPDGHVQYAEKAGQIERNRRAKETDEQRGTRFNFKAAAHYARTVLQNDPALKAYYLHKAKKLGLPNAYTAALTDYMRRGKIESVSRKKYTGKDWW